MNIKNLKKIIMMFFFISVSIFANCKENGNKMKFSFEEIQDLYLQEMKQTGANNLCPFYINKNFFKKVEDELNELISKSDFYSVRICVNVDNNILNVTALYNLGNEIYFKVWKRNAEQMQNKITNKSAKKILKTKPKALFLIEDTKLPIFDRKKIDKEIYYYAYYYRPYDSTYKPIIDLFREVYEGSL